jgi:hypothetical protein
MNSMMKAVHYDYFTSLGLLGKVKYIICRDYLKDVRFEVVNDAVVKVIGDSK